MEALPEEDLKGLIGRYPYAPVYKVLLARLYKNSGHPGFRDALRNAALQVPDRVSLYEYLHYKEEEVSDLAGVVSTVEAEPAVIEESAVDPPSDEASSSIVESPGEPVEETDSSHAILEEEIAEEVSDDFQPEEKTFEKEIAVQEEVTSETEELPGEDADLSGAASPLDPISDGKEAESILPVVPERMDTLKQLAQEKGIEDTEDEAAIMQFAARSHVTLDEKHTFLEWLQILEGHTPVEAKPADEPEELPEISEEEEVAILETQIDEYSAARSYEANIQREASDMEEHDLEARLEADESAAVKDLADKSLSLDTGLVTETLAKLMLMQGKKTESIALYEQLRLIYPEKSDYFAAQIEAIKTK